VNSRDDSAAEATRALQRTIRNIATVVAILAFIGFAVFMTQRESDKSQRQAEELTDCLVAGRSDCDRFRAVVDSLDY
jgi:hypothetical protein